MTELSRSEQKRRVKQLEQLVSELGGLGPSQINELPCSEEIRSLVRESLSLKGGAKQRQIRYITKLLKHEPVDELYAYLSDKKGKALQENKAFHELEYLREALLSEAIEQHRVARSDGEELEEDWPSEVAEDIGRRYPGIDKSMLTRLAWLYARTRSARHSRELFRIIRAAHEQAAYSRQLEEKDA